MNFKLRTITHLSILTIILALAAGILVPSAFAGNTATVSVTVGAESTFTVTTSSTTLTGAGAFAPFTGTTNFTYGFRTTSTGTGSIQMKVTTDFSPSNGPSVANPPSAGDTLSYASTVSTPATAVNGTASTTTQTNVATLPANSNSASTADSGSVSWTLVNDPKYKSGSYQATVTFTISAS